MDRHEYTLSYPAYTESDGFRFPGFVSQPRTLEQARRGLASTIAQRARDAAAGLPDHTGDPLPVIVRRRKASEWKEMR